MAKKSGIELKLTYGFWNCMAPAKYKSLASALKQNIKDVVLNGCREKSYRLELPALVRAPFMDIDTTSQMPYVKVELNEKRVKTTQLESGLEINYNGPVNVTMCWRVH